MAKPKDPLKLMPLEAFGKLIEAVARVPKDAVPGKGALEQAKPSKGRPPKP